MTPLTTNSSPYRKNPPRIGIFWIGVALAFCGVGVLSALFPPRERWWLESHSDFRHWFDL